MLKTTPYQCYSCLLCLTAGIFCVKFPCLRKTHECGWMHQLLMTSAAGWWRTQVMTGLCEPKIAMFFRKCLNSFLLCTYCIVYGKRLTHCNSSSGSVALNGAILQSNLILIKIKKYKYIKMLLWCHIHSKLAATYIHVHSNCFTIWVF